MSEALTAFELAIVALTMLAIVLSGDEAGDYNVRALTEASAAPHQEASPRVPTRPHRVSAINGRI